jgi:hypothetical protein
MTLTPKQREYWLGTECCLWATEAGIEPEQQFEDLEDMLACYEADPARFSPEDWLADTWGIEPDHVLELIQLMV